MNSYPSEIYARPTKSKTLAPEERRNHAITLRCDSSSSSTSLSTSSDDDDVSRVSDFQRCNMSFDEGSSKDKIIESMCFQNSRKFQNERHYQKVSSECHVKKKDNEKSTEVDVKNVGESSSSHGHSSRKSYRKPRKHWQSSNPKGHGKDRKTDGKLEDDSVSLSSEEDKSDRDKDTHIRGNPHIQPKKKQPSDIKASMKNEVEDNLKRETHSTMNGKTATVSKSCEGQRENLVPRIVVVLQVKKLYEDDSLENILEAKFNDFGKISFSCDEIRGFWKKNETYFHFSVYSIDMSLAIKSLKTVVFDLKRELGIQLKYSYEKKFPITKGNLDSGKKEMKEPSRNSKEMTESLKSEIQNALHFTERKKVEVLNNHKKRIDDMQTNIRKLLSRESDYDFFSEKDMEDKNVLQQKLEELKLQEAEFIQCYKRLCKDLKSLDTSTAKQTDVSHLLKTVGIECTRLKNALPIYARRTDIVDHVQSHQVSIILGETGSGKSTQLIQYLYEAGFAKHESIICTQPRRIAAMSLAERVAGEMVESVGNLVGFKAGTSKKSNENTKLFFTTDHSLLNECLKDPELHNYSCIIVDEAHERSIYTDILLGVIKICLQKRPNLKVIITSATIDPEVFIKYFGSGPELRVSGRTFPVALSYNEDGRDDFENYEERAVSKAVEVHCKEGPGDILVFLTSPAEIMRCCEEFEKRCHGKTDFECLPLHGQLPPEEQKQVFETLPCGKRKIVFATNCAETSITIDGIKFVIDTGVAKEMKYDPKRNMNQLGIHAISKSSADQRKGRAGRTASGKCFRLYSQESFQAMESINDPEILRVHLGQAILKLSELGVNIRSYDFVQAPSETALSSAIETLEYLGAIVDNKITDIGRWISKLPFDPKLGYVVYEANKNDLLFDAIVLAAVISSGSDLFFRGFTESESQVVAKSKIFFGSKLGDTFTWLQVYKEWCEVQENNRSWCRSRCINYKCISYVNQCIKDTKIILSRDLGIDLVQQFSKQTEAMDKLRKILFIANADSISNFSEVSRAGYFSLVPERQVHLHPSSILVALNLHPQWLVYTNLVRTSQEFIKGITVVEEEWVHELVETGKLKVDITKAKQNKYYSIHHEEVGPSIFRALVGPCFSNLRVLEEELLISGLLRSVLEVSRELGTLDIHSPFSMNQIALAKINEIKSSSAEKLLSEDFEFNLSKKESIISSGTRVVIGRGGCVKSIFMPNQSDKVIIKRIHPKVSEEEILKKFEAFGEIKEIIQFKSYDPWGFVRYSSVAEALKAVEETSKDEFNAGILKLDKHAKHVKNMFEAKLTWIRRPIKGSGTAFLKCSPLDQSSLIGQSIWVLGRCCPIKVGKKGDLVIFNTASLTENEVKDKVLNMMMHQGTDLTDLEVSVARETVPVSEDRLKEKADIITSFIKKYMKEDSFKVNMLKPKQGSIHHICFVSFTDPVRGYEVCKKMGSLLFIDGRPVDVSPCLKTVVHVPQKLKAACEERFKTLFSGLAQYKGTVLTWKKLKKDYAVEIKSSRPADIVDARDLICKEMEGDIIDCSVNDFLSCLLNKVGQERLKEIEKNNEGVIMTDFRSSKIHLYGSVAKISKMQQDINSYLTEIEGSEQGLINMKGPDKPPGLMKAAMRKYGSQLDSFVEEFGLKSVKVNWKKHSIQLLGTKHTVEKASHSLDALAKELWKEVRHDRESCLPDCLVCMCPIEAKEVLFRLEVCGHAYCLDCLQQQISYAVNNKDFPLTCAGEGCQSPFVWRDIRFALSKKWVREDKLVSMSVNAFVMANRDKYKYCLTPNCPVVYEVTEDENGCEFNCPLCLASICSTCHIAFHAGLSCLMAKSGVQAESELKNWTAKDPSRRQLCPRCNSPIEKLEGCNKMHCPSCRTYFCWVCLKIAPTEDDCYRHLRKEHGGFY